MSRGELILRPKDSVCGEADQIQIVIGFDLMMRFASQPLLSIWTVALLALDSSGHTVDGIEIPWKIWSLEFHAGVS
jgi:hypothetical protein